MRNGYPSLPLCLKRLRSLAGALLLALGALGVEAQAAPAIGSISPESGTATTRVTIKGKRFGSSQGSGRVTFGGLEASRYYQWSDTRIQVRPPAGLVAGTHAVVVTGAGGVSGGVDYTVLGKLTAFCLGPGQTIAEPEGSFEMGVHRSGPTEAALTVTVTYSGTATHGSDYRAPETLTIEAGERRASATLEVIDDAVEEGEERIKYQVSADGYRPGSCRVTLEDNDTGAPAAPEISGLNPASGAVGTSVEITGMNFGVSEGTSTVEFAGTEAEPSSWSETRITAPVPEGARTGAVVVTVEGVASNGVGFTVTAPGPEISGLEPTSGEVGTSVTITGGNFGSGGSVTFAGTGANTTGWSGTSITATVPEGATSGAVVVTVNGVASNGVGFTVRAPGPEISGLEPTSGEVGTSVTITGANFGAGGSVTFAGTGANTTSWSGTSITATVPEGATSGAVVVTVGGVASNGVGFTVRAPGPEISGLDPTSGEVGTSVTITGANFGAGGSVTFAGTGANTTSWSGTSITATVPEGATSGAVVVTVNGVASNGVGFTVRSPGPEISGLDPTSGEVGTSVTITGGNFGSGGSVTFAGTGANTTGWSGTSITATVPEGATSGAVVVTVEGVASNGVGFTVGEAGDRPLRLLCASSVSEPSGVARYIFAYVGRGNEPDEDMTVGLAYSGTATHEVDYTAPEALTIPAGRSSGTMSPRLAVVDDRVFEGEERIELTATAEGYETATCTIALEDDETVTAPAISGLSPASGPVGTPVEIRGEHFGSSEGTSSVTFAGTEAEPSSWSETRITARVPAGAATGDVVVTVGGEASPGVGFAVTASSAGVNVVPTALEINEGGTGTYTVVLDTQPAAAVTVTVFAGSGLSVDRFPVFGVTDWATPQTVTVTADQDGDDQDETHRISHQTSSADGDYHGLTVDEVEVTVTDDEGTGNPGGTLALTVSTTELRITEGNSGSYTVVLNAEPPEAVTVAVRARVGGDLTVMPSLLEFTVSNWDEPQEVTVTAGEDADLLDEVESITHTVSLASEAAMRGIVGGRSTFAFSAVPVLAREYVYLGGRLVGIDPGASVSSVASVVVTIEDNDDAGEVGIPTSTPRLVLTEGNSGSYTLELGSEPTAEVTVALTVALNADVTVSPAMLTFKPGDPGDPGDPERWNRSRRVTVTVSQDDDADDETEVIRHGVTSADSDYAGIADFTVTVSIRDDDDEDELVTPGPAEGILMADPNPCFIPMGQTQCTFTLSWTLTNTDTIQVQDENDTVIRERGGVGDTVTQSLGETPEFTYHLYDYTNNVLGKDPLYSVKVVVLPEPPGPKITSLSPDSGIVSRWVTITGMRFGASQGASTVTFNGTPVSSGGIISWSDTVIEARVPAGASSGPVVVTVGEFVSNGVHFTVRPTITCEAWPTDIKVGASSTLSWTTVGASSLTIDDGDDQTPPITVASADVAAGSHMVTPAATTDYSLKATAADGQAAYCTGRVTLWEAPVIEVFRADPEDINEGEVTRLSWGTTHTTSVEIDQGIGSVSVVDGGYVDVAPARTTPYTLTATNRAWEGSDGVTAEVEVRVTPNPGGPTITCSPASSDLFRGNSETLEWTTTGATSLTIDDGDGNAIFTAGATEVARGMHSVITG